MRYRLRTLLILLALLPPLLWIGWSKYVAWRAEQERQRALREQNRVLESWASDLWQPETDLPVAAPPVKAAR